VRVTSLTTSSATIQWMLTDPYNPSWPETFIVCYGVTSGQLNMSTPGVSANPTSQTYSTQLSPLQPGTEYFYRIMITNRFDTQFVSRFFTTEDKSELHIMICIKCSVSFCTLHGLESSTVTNLQAESPNDTTMLISWEPPANPNGIIFHYFISIVNLHSGGLVRRERLLSMMLAESRLGEYHRVSLRGGRFLNSPQTT
jgi:hypothetical protein